MANQHAQPVHICVISDEGYIIPTSVMLCSAKRNKKKESHYIVHFICRNISDFSKKKVNELSSPDFEIRFYDRGVNEFGSVVMKTHVPVAALIKFHIAEILEDVEKVLYVDGDILILKDLQELYWQELGDNLLGGVRDMGAELHFHLNETVGVEKYINSGVMLMNLDRLREERTAESFVNTKLSAPPEWKCADQDTFNAVCKGRVKYLPVRFNAMIPLFRNTISYNYSIEEVNSFYGEDYGTWQEINDDACIIHFAGEHRLRPWSYYHGTFGDVWQRYYNKSPFADIDLQRTYPAGARPRHNTPPVKADGCKKSDLYLRLFGFLPFLKIAKRAYRTSYYLFFFLPILRVRTKGAKSTGLLFAFIPVYSQKIKNR